MKINFHSSEIKEERGWFSTWSSTSEEMEDQREPPTRNPGRLTPPPRTVPQTPSEPRHYSTQTARPSQGVVSSHPTPRSVSHSSNEMRVYTQNNEDQQDSSMSLPPTTTALVVKKKVK